MAVPRTHQLSLWCWPRRGAAFEFRHRGGTSGEGVDGCGRSWPCLCEPIHGQQDLPGHLAEVDVAKKMPIIYGDLWWKTWAMGIYAMVILEDVLLNFACAKHALATHCARVFVFLMFSHIGFVPECMSAMGILIFWCDFCRIDLTFQLAVPWGWCDFCPSDVT